MTARADMYEKDSKAHISSNADFAPTENVTARLRNPLDGIPRETLRNNVEEFAHEKGLTEHIDILWKGALLAQSPQSWDSIQEINDHERGILSHERDHRWSHPLTLYVTIALCSVGAAVQGWDQTGSNGANLSFPLEFNILGNEWMTGIVNAGPYLGSVGLGCWLSDPLNRMFGRRGCIFITALILIATPIASGFTHSWQTLFVVRLIMGIGMGAKGSTVPVLAAENSPANIRGALTMTWQLWTAFGIFLGFAANVVCLEAFTGSMVWRTQLGSAFIPAVPLLLIYMVPESPRWLMKKNRYPQAWKALCRLRHDPIQAARDIYYVHVQLELEKQVMQSDSYIRRFGELFVKPRVKRATLAASVVMLAQQMCGINIIAFYSSTVFKQSGYDDRQALYASLGFGAINFTFAWPAIFTIDTFGRRSLLLATFPNMAWTLLAAGLSTLVDDAHQKVRLGLVATFIYLFAAFYSVGEGPVPFAYSAEVFPLSHREVGMAWAVTVCLGFAAVLSITFPQMLAVMTTVGAFCFYAGLNVIAFFLILLFLPETKQRTLEELDQIFSIPTSQFVSYQTTQVVPYFFKRHLMRNKSAHLEPLIQVESEMAGITKAEKADLEKRLSRV